MAERRETIQFNALYPEMRRKKMCFFPALEISIEFLKHQEKKSLFQFHNTHNTCCDNI